MVGNSVGERVFQLAVSLVQVTAYCCRCASCRTAPHLARQWCAWWQLPDGAGSRAGFPGISTGREQIQHLHSAGWCLDKKKNHTKPTHNLKQSRNPSLNKESVSWVRFECVFTFWGEAQRADSIVVPVQGGVRVFLIMVKVSP